MPPEKDVPTIRTLARLANVSPSTVSRVLRNRPGVSAEVAQRVIQAIEESGSTIAAVRASSTRRLLSKVDGAKPGLTRVIGVLIPHLSSPFYAEILKGIEKEAYTRGYTVNLYSAADRGYINVLHRIVDNLQCQGLIIMSPRDEEPVTAINDHFKSLPPVIVVDHRSEGGVFPHIAVDNLNGALQGTRYLIEQGHRRIAFLTGIPTIQSAIDRLRGYRLALDEAGIEYDPNLVITGDFMLESGRRAATEWLKEGKPLPDAWFCSNDMMALGVMQALQRSGYSVPGDMAVMGFDDLPLANWMSPKLTTIAQPMEKMGELAVRMALTMIEGGGEPGPRVVLDTKLMVRESA